MVENYKRRGASDGKADRRQHARNLGQQENCEPRGVGMYLKYLNISVHQYIPRYLHLSTYHSISLSLYPERLLPVRRRPPK